MDSADRSSLRQKIGGALRQSSGDDGRDLLATDQGPCTVKQVDTLAHVEDRVILDEYTVQLSMLRI
jgi:hypothetical protein